MSNKRSWWLENWKSLVWFIFFMGVAWTTIGYKIDRTEAREIVILEIKDKCYSKTNGKILENNFIHIKEQLTRMENQINNIKKLIESIHPPN